MRDPDIPVRTDAEVVAMVDELVGGAIRRQLWLFFEDADQRPVQLVMPIDDVPVDPDPEDVARLADSVRHLVAMSGAALAIVVWERPGGPDLEMQEADWVAGIARSGAPVRCQLLSSDDGVRLIDPDFDQLVAA